MRNNNLVKKCESERNRLSPVQFNGNRHFNFDSLLERLKLANIIPTKCSKVSVTNFNRLSVYHSSMMQIIFVLREVA